MSSHNCNQRYRSTVTSDASQPISFVSGSELVVDEGYTAR